VLLALYTIAYQPFYWRRDRFTKILLVKEYGPIGLIEVEDKLSNFEPFIRIKANYREHLG